MPPTMIEYQRQADTVQSVRELRDAHPERGLDWVLQKVHVSRATFFRYESNVKAGVACIKERNAGGRPRKYVLTAEEVTKLRSLVAIRDSVDYAIEEFADCPQCGHATRTLILHTLEMAQRGACKPRWPESLRRAARITPAERAELRGEKHAGELTLAPRIGLFERDRHGVDHYIKAHSTWTMDDESINRPYLVPCHVHPNFRDIVDPRYHWKLCRQFLKGMDIYSEAWLGLMAVGRERDQYRGEDIVRFIYELVMAHGTLPDKIIMEQGRWKGSAVHGVAVHDGHREIMWGGLDELFQIDHKETSRGKAWLETGLRLGQRASAHTGEDIGGVRGEFELANKHWMQIQRQAALLEEGRIPKVLRDPLALGFLTQEQAEQIEAETSFQLNCRAKQREAFGKRTVVPNDLLQNAITPRPLPESERWRFFPQKREATIMRGGAIKVSVEGYPYPFMFVVNGVVPNLHLENGYRVLIAFDPQRTDLGCVVGNAEVGSRNRGHFGFGAIMLTAPFLPPAPMSNESEVHEPDYKKRARATVRSGFAEVKKHITDARAARIRQTLDEHGRTSRVSNRPEAAPHQHAAPRRKPVEVDQTALRRREAAMLGEEETEFQSAGSPGD